MKISVTKMKITFREVGYDCFIPIYGSGINFLKKCNYGNEIIFSHTKSRNPKHHNLIFAIARCILDNLPEQHFLKNQLPYDIIKTIMLDAGIVEYKLNLNGTTRVEPKSISFENMSEDEFQPVSEAMFRTGAMILGIEPHELEKNYLEYL